MSEASIGKPEHRRSWRARLALILGSALGTAVLCEVVARVFAWRHEVHAMSDWQRMTEQKLKPGREVDTNLGHVIRLATNPRMVYELIPSLEFQMQGVPCKTNEHGFRSPAVPVQKPEGVYRVVVLGDSVAFGHGVAEAEAFPQQLQALLQKARGGPVQVINTGVPGYNTAMEVEMLIDKGLAFGPDLVVYHFVPNDVDLPNLIWNPQNYWSLLRSFLWEQLAKAWQTPDPWTDRPWTTAPIENGRYSYQEHLAPQYRDMVGTDMFRRELQRLKQLGEEHHFRIVVSLHYEPPPYAPQICHEVGLPTVSVDQRINAYMHERGIAKYLGSELVISETDQHPRPIGHRFIAEAIAERVIADGMLSNK